MTRVVTKGELGRPVGRLREQMEKMQLHSSHRSEGKADMLEQQLVMAGERVRRLEGEKQVAETRAEIAERRVSTSLVPRPLEKFKKTAWYPLFAHVRRLRYTSVKLYGFYVAIT